MTEKFKNFQFPTWEEFKERNRSFLEKGIYKGYSLKVQVSDNLHLLIDCQNESTIFPANDDVVRFAWCTNNEFAISSVKYVNCEAGYLMGCAHLINTANEFKKCFEEFVSDHTRIIRKRISAYELAHPEHNKEEKQEGIEK